MRKPDLRDMMEKALEQNYGTYKIERCDGDYNYDETRVEGIFDLGEVGLRFLTHLQEHIQVEAHHRYREWLEGIEDPASVFIKRKGEEQGDNQD